MSTELDDLAKPWANKFTTAVCALQIPALSRPVEQGPTRCRLQQVSSVSVGEGRGGSVGHTVVQLDVILEY